MENSLVLNLLSSPEALEFALRHQKQKVEELQQTTARLLSNMIQAGILPSNPSSPLLPSPHLPTSPQSSSSSYPQSPEPSPPQPKHSHPLPPTFKFPEPIKVYPIHNGVVPPYITPFPPGHVTAFPPDHVTPDKANNTIPVRHKLQNYPSHHHEGRQTIPVIKKEPTPRTKKYNPTPDKKYPQPENKMELTPQNSQPPKFPKLEIVVEGDMANIDPELLTSTLWDSDTDSMGEEDDIPSSYPNQRYSKKRTPFLHKTFDNHNNLSADWYTLADLPPSGDPGIVWEWKNALKDNRSSFIQWKNAVDYTKSRRFRTKIEPHMLSHLEDMYQRKHFVSCEERKELAEKIGMTERAVVYWFQNRRRKDMRNYHNSMVS